MDEEEIKRRVIFGSGYGKPPQHSQFKKGQSGNPKGRPKKASADLSLTDQPMLSAILDVANKMVSVREDGAVIEISMREAVIRATFASAIKNNSRSQDIVFRWLAKSDESKVHHVRDRNAFWEEYKRDATAAIVEAKKRGEPAPKSLPHPDDIVIDHQKGPRFIGPVTEQDQARLDHTLRLRDVLILQDALDHRSKQRLNGEPLTEPGGAELLAMVLENFVPPRLRLSNTEWAWQAMNAEGLPKLILLKQLYAQWRKIGYPLPRGFVFPDINYMKRQIEQRIAIAKELHALPFPDDMPHGEWERAAAKIISVHLGTVG